ncbi:hypothetical protein Tco_0675519 [Tanacetum coccineum]
MPRGTTQVVTRGASNDWCQMCRYESEVSVHVSTRYCSGDGWTNQMVTRGTGVCQYEPPTSPPSPFAPPLHPSTTTTIRHTTSTTPNHPTSLITLAATTPPYAITTLSPAAHATISTPPSP